MGSAVSSPSGVRGRAPENLDFVPFWTSEITSERSASILNLEGATSESVGTCSLPQRRTAPLFTYRLDYAVPHIGLQINFRPLHRNVQWQRRSPAYCSDWQVHNEHTHTHTRQSSNHISCHRYSTHILKHGITQIQPRRWLHVKIAGNKYVALVDLLNTDITATYFFIVHRKIERTISKIFYKKKSQLDFSKYNVLLNVISCLKNNQQEWNTTRSYPCQI